MKKYWSGLLKSLTPYVPGEQPKNMDFIKLNTNENPYPPSPELEKALAAANLASLRLYPRPDADELRSALAAKFGLTEDQIFCGNGSDEILSFAFAAFFDGQSKTLFPDISYSFYPVYADFYSLPYEQIPLNDDFTVPVELFCENRGGVALANPNAPTGICLGLDQIEKIAASNPGHIVLIDEAYVDFGGESAVPLTQKYENLLVIQTFSKSYSLAGLRLGYAIGSAGLIAGLRAVKDSFNSYTVDRLTVICGLSALADSGYHDMTRRKIMATRSSSAERFTGLGFEVLPSMANFLFVRHSSFSAKELQRGLYNEGVLVRRFNQAGIDNFLRISIGTDSEMELLFEKLSKLMDK